MKLKKWLENWDMTSLKINLKFLEMEFQPNDEDKEAAWELYIEMLTRVASQGLDPAEGDERTALESIFSLFSITREIARRKGRHCAEFTKIAIVVLNQVIRPFSAKWHSLAVKGGLEDSETSIQFRSELKKLQASLRKYTQMLASMAEVEDLTSLERE